MTTFGCFGDALGSAVGLRTVSQILLDGANGVGQAQRSCSTLEPSAVLAWVVAFLLVIAWRHASWRTPRGRVVALAILACSYIPGWFHTLVIRADRPSAQRSLAREVASSRAVYVSAMQTALATTPPSACFVPVFLGSCINPSGIYLGAARDLWPRFQCVGGEASVVTIEVSACGPTDARTHVVP